MKKVFKTIAALSALLAFASTTTAQTYNVTTDFSTNTNPNGVWSYGAMDSGFTNFRTTPWKPDWGAWADTVTLANVWKNTGTSTEYGIPPGGVSFHPGTGSEPAVIRWTAPNDFASASIFIDGSFGTGDSGTPSLMIRNGTNDLWTGTDSGMFGLTTSVFSGDTIDFYVYGISSYANTLVDAAITVQSAVPAILAQPQSVYTDPGDLVFFEVEATSPTGTLSYVWMKDSVPLADNEYISGANTRRLAISPARLADVGDYQVAVSGSTGTNISSVATLTLNLPLPAITSEPANLTQGAGPASFAVSATNAATYQWYYGETPVTNGGAFSGATTTTLQINATQTNNGVYSVRVSNARGTVASKPARLTITANTTVGDAIDNNTVLLTNPGGWYSQSTYTADGTDAARSGPITHNQQSALTATLTGPGEVSFQHWVDSEGADPLRTALDGTVFNAISGTGKSWTQVSTFIPYDTHVLKWEYAKDGSVNTGVDAGFVDQFTFSPYDLSSVEAAVDMPSQALTLGGAARWYGQDAITQDGTDAARSPRIGDNQQAWFEATVTGPGRIIFWSRTSCESADRAVFRVDGNARFSFGGFNEWQATTNWINWGAHTLRWAYEKDGSIASADDAVWFDRISYTPVSRSSLAEAADATELVWTTSASSPWFGQDRFTDDGTDSVQSGVIPDNGQSWIKAIADGPGTLSFRWKALSENPDRLRFYTNGVFVAETYGNSDWSTYNLNLTNNTGAVEFKWSYEKDGSAAALEDAVWIDQVAFAPQRPSVTLAVASALGSPVPFVGIHTNDWNSQVTCSVTDIVVGDTQYECVGWTGTGSVPSSGTSNSVEVTLTEDSSITWLWQTNHWLQANVTGSGSVNHPTGWYAKGSVQNLIATPDVGWLFMGWSGDASGTNNAAITMDAPKTVMATFSDDADGDGLSNAEEAGYGSNPWKADTDGDGFDDFFEVGKGLSPTNDDSDVAAYIQTHDDTFGLYSSNVVLDVAIGEMLLDVVGSEATLNLQLETSDDLNTWSNAGPAKVWTWGVDGEKKFFRVRSSK